MPCHADDLAVITITEELIKRLNKWKDNVESKGMRVNVNKTKVMISGERQKVRQKAVRRPCGVCSKGVGSNSLQCTSYQKWVHKKWSGIKGSMSKVAIKLGCWQAVTHQKQLGLHFGLFSTSFISQCFFITAAAIKTIHSIDCNANQIIPETCHQAACA